MEETPKRRPGRPAKTPEGPKRASLKLRVHDRTRAALERSAAENGRSLSEEAEWLLEQAMQGPKILDQALDLAFGRQIAGLLLVIGRSSRDTASSVRVRLPGVTKLIPAGETLTNPLVFDQIAGAISRILEVMRPPGEVDQQEFPTGRSFATMTLHSIASDDPAHHIELAKEARERLGPDVVNRIRKVLPPPVEGSSNHGTCDG